MNRTELEDVISKGATFPDTDLLAIRVALDEYTREVRVAAQADVTGGVAEALREIAAGLMRSADRIEKEADRDDA